MAKASLVRAFSRAESPGSASTHVLVERNDVDALVAHRLQYRLKLGLGHCDVRQHKSGAHPLDYANGIPLRLAKSDVAREGNTHRAAVMLAGFQLASCNS
jgi:hypothetical protein